MSSITLLAFGMSFSRDMFFRCLSANYTNFRCYVAICLNGKLAITPSLP